MHSNNERQRITAYKFGEGYGTLPNGQIVHGWPYIVHYTPESKSGDFYLSEGDGRNGNGSYFASAVLLEPRWRSHLETSGTLWLIPLLERREAGETVSPREFLDAYQAVHGEPAPVEQWPVY